jgi:DNA-binding transcriptional MerR regulator
MKEGSTLLKIGAVARLTGLSVHVLRKWEERHRAVVPVRTGRGERLYQREDVRRLALIKRLTEAGVGLAEVAAMAIDDLERVAAEVVVGKTAHQQGRASAVRVMLVGDALPALASRGLTDSGHISIVSSSSNVHGLARAGADADYGAAADVLVLELPTLQLASANEVRDAMSHCGTAACVVIYGFASEAALTLLRRPGIALLRAPASVETLQQTLLQLVATLDTVTPAPAALLPAAERAAVPAPRLSREIVARVAATSPSVKCECPKHIAEIVFNLMAFEQYSHECETLDPDDEALHRFLGDTAATARAAFEEALVRVARAEGIPLEG